MRKLIALALILTFAAAACAAEGSAPEGPKGPNALRSFRFSTGGYTVGRTYDVFMLDGEYYLCADQAPSRKMDAAAAEALTQIILKYDLTGWDGFHGNDPDVLDGEDFSMEFILADGTSVSASGSNDFPGHYREVRDEVTELLEAAASGWRRDAAGIYRYEGEGFGGDFTITIARDGTYTFYEGLLSSYLGGGRWHVSGREMTMTEENGADMYLMMIPVEDALVFSPDNDDNFPYVRVPAGGRFVRDGAEPYGEAFRLDFDSFDGGGPRYRIDIGDPEILTFSSETRYRDENHEELDGAGYNTSFYFIGLKPGTTQVTVTGESPVAGTEVYHYQATVDEHLNVIMEGD